MQVSQQDSHITHAVLGNQESVSMGVSNDAALMHIFSATLYTYPKLATVREIVCNAWDAHIAAGITNRPIEVTVDSRGVTVRDFGFGIPHAKIGEIYGTYGNSTKRDDSTVTGGFGLGSKSPFAYTDNFEVVSHHVGTKTVYRVSKSSMEKGGKPTINKIVDMPTTETGMQVSFSMLNSSDVDTFLQLVKEVIQFGEIPVKLNDEVVDLVLPMSKSNTGYLINDHRCTIRGRVKLRYGNVVYPIPEHDQYAEMFQRISRDMDALWHNTSIIFMAEPDTITIAPSRETLILTDATVEAITALLKKYKPYSKVTASHTVLQVALEGLNQQIKKAQVPVLMNCIMKRGGFTTHRHMSLSVGRAFDTPQRAMTAFTMERGCEVNIEAQVLKMLIELKRRGELPRKLGRDLVRTMTAIQGRYDRNKSLKGLVTKYVSAPITMAMKKYPELQGVNSRCFMNQGYYEGSMYTSMMGAFVHHSNLNIFFQKNAIIARNIREVEKYLKEETHYKHGYTYVMLVGSGKDAELKTVAAQLMLEELNYAVETYFPERVKVTRKPVIAADGTVLPDPEVKPKKKKDTYLTLAQSYSSTDRNFLLSRAREVFTPEDMVSDPIAWVVLRPKNDNSEALNYYSKEVSRYIHSMWGEKIAVVTAAQATKLEQKGVPALDAFIYEYIDNVLVNSPDFKRYLAGAHFYSYNDYGVNKIVKRMCYHPTLLKEFGIRLHIDTDAAAIIQMASKISSDFRRFPQAEKLVQKIKPNRSLAALINKMELSPMYPLIANGTICTNLERYPPNSIQLTATYEMLRMVLK